MKAKVIPAQLPSRERIAICAYIIWEREGCPDGRDIAHWLEAEMQLAVSCIHDVGLSQCDKPFVTKVVLDAPPATRRNAK